VRQRHFARHRYSQRFGHRYLHDQQPGHRDLRVTAVYSGNAAFAASTSTAVSQVINPLTPTVTTLVVSPNPGGAGQSITFTGTVAPMPVGAPLGTITFSAGEGSIGTAAVNPVGVATITVTAPSETGTFTITAVYSGNALFATSTSAGLSVTLVPAFGVTAPQTPFPLAQGGLVTVAVTVPPIGGAFNNVVTLSATGQPLGSTVTFNPPMVTPGAAGTTTMMTVQLPSLIAGVPAGVSTENVTEVSSGGLPRPPGRHIPLTPISVAAMAALLLSRAFGKKRMARFGLATATLAAVLLVIAGCKGGLAGGSSTPPGNYVITITGTSGNLHASTTVTIVVSK
jgi:Bacterial Ig-like domain (group 3)